MQSVSSYNFKSCWYASPSRLVPFSLLTDISLSVPLSAVDNEDDDSQSFPYDKVTDGNELIVVMDLITVVVGVSCLVFSENVPLILLLLCGTSLVDEDFKCESRERKFAAYDISRAIGFFTRDMLRLGYTASKVGINPERGGGDVPDCFWLFTYRN